MRIDLLQFVAAQPWVERLGWALVHFCWQGVLISAAYAATRRLRNAQARYTLACIALATMAAAPVITFGLADTTGSAANTPFVGTGQHTVASTAIAQPSVSLTAPASSQWHHNPMPWLVLAWFSGAVVFWIRLTGGWIIAARMKSKLAHPAPAPWQQTLDQLKVRIRISRPVRLLVSARVQVPSVVGWLRPVILLPIGALVGLPPDHIEALLAHELAHIRRHDYFVNILQSVTEALLFYHPAVWWISRQIRHERELCCDDIAVAISGDALNYARALADLESHRPAHFNPALAANGGSLPERIGRILGQPRKSAQVLKPGPGAAVAAALIFVAAYGLFGQPAGSRPVFEVASVKMRGPASGPQSTVADDEHGAVHYSNVSLKACILTAWNIKPFQLEGLEGRAPERYDIEARADHPASGPELRAMLQPLLEERFKLRFHNESREMPVYRMTVGNAKMLHKATEGDGGSEFTSGENPRLDAQGMSMQRLAGFLSGIMDRPVFDATGAPGLFRFALDWRNGKQADKDDSIAAAAERVGLKLERSKATVQIMIVDHVETVPTAN